ncbi:MAG: seryl-tRNA synthetase [Saprospiraceae bacterium]|jgi:seryl-tRNA synthetase
MLQVSFINANRDRVIEGLRIRNFSDDDLTIIDEVIALDNTRKSTQSELDDLLAQNNQLSKNIGDLFKEGKREAAEGMKAQVADLKEDTKRLQGQLNTTKDKLDYLLLKIPNIPHPSVPVGNSDADNEVRQDWPGKLPDLGETALPHWDLAKKYNLIDFELGVKITGSGFPLFRGKGAKLQRALINFFLDEAHEAGYEEIVPPLLVNEASARGTGQLPDKDGQMYYAEKDDLYLIPTAEVPVTNMLRDVILEESDLPVKLTGYTPCFRREAGAYGKDVRGLNRVHQFDKIEIVQAAHPDHSYEVLENMLRHVEGLLNKLELPYRILRLCGGDLTSSSALTFDFEVYSAAQKRWLEVSSVSNFETYQSNRLKLRYRDENRKLQLAHTLNGSALALARIVAALLENNQTPDGIVIPVALRPYTRFDIIN